MNRYDPDQTPNPEEWLALDEHLRIGLVESYHRRARVELPNATIHAAFHVVVENQPAENYEPTARAMTRLTTEGLCRHEAVHALASVVTEHRIGGALTLPGIAPLLPTKPDPPSRHGCVRENAAHTAIPERTRLYTASRVRCCAGLQKQQPALDPASEAKI